jgi:hypothetical protein
VSTLSTELDKIQAKVDYLQAKKTLNMQEQFDLSQLMLTAAFLRLDWLDAEKAKLETRVRHLEEILKENGLEGS